MGRSQNPHMNGPPTVGKFIVTVLKRSMATWQGGEWWFSLAAYVAILALPVLFYGVIADLLGQAVETGLAYAAIGWLVVLILFITPYRMWRDERLTSTKRYERLQPKIVAFYDDNSPTCRKRIRYGGESGTKGIVIRAEIRSASDAMTKNCLGHLTKIEFNKTGDEFEEIHIYEPYRLPWAAERNEFQPVDIVPRVPKFLVVCEAVEGSESFGYRSNIRSYVSPNQFSDIGKYRFQVEVVGHESSGLSLVFEILWSGKWDQISARLVEKA